MNVNDQQPTLVVIGDVSEQHRQPTERQRRRQVARAAERAAAASRTAPAAIRPARRVRRVCDRQGHAPKTWGDGSLVCGRCGLILKAAAPPVDVDHEARQRARMLGLSVPPSVAEREQLRSEGVDV